MAVNTKILINDSKVVQTGTLTHCGINQIAASGRLKYMTDQSASFSGLSVPDVAFVTGCTSAIETNIANNYYNKTQINYYTGTTVPNTYYNKTQINFYTGATDIRIDNIEAITDIAVTGATNGLTKVGREIRLGGTLTGSTIITDGRGTPVGLQYGGDYSANYTARSIPDVDYVTGLTSLGIQTANNGLTKVGTNVVLGGALTKDTCVYGSYDYNVNTNEVNITGGTTGINLGGVVSLKTAPSGTGGLLCINSSTGQICQTSLAAFGGITGATNGLTDCGSQQIGLGGTLCADTSICGAGFDLSLGASGSKLDLLNVHSSGNVSITSDNNLLVSVSGGTITTSDTKGLRYTSDYSNTFENNSLVTKLYVDTVASGLDPKSAVFVATTGSNLDLSGTETIDDVALTGGERVLVKDQTNKTENGIYIVNAGGAWTRATDFDGTPVGEVTQGALIPVLSGSTNINSSWILITPDPITIDTTELTFSKFSQLLDIAEGNGINISTVGETKTISVELASNSGLEFSGTGLSVDDAIAGNGLTWNSGVINVNAPSGGTLGVAVKRDGSDNLVVNTADINTALGGVLSGTTNGISEITTGVAGLGGALTQATTICGTDTFTLTYQDDAITNQRGILYADDYSGTYVDRSLVDKEYVDNAAGAIAADNGLTRDGNTIILGGTLTGDTEINVDTYLLNISGGTAAILMVDGSGDFASLGDYNNGSSYVALSNTEYNIWFGDLGGTCGSEIYGDTTSQFITYYEDSVANACLCLNNTGVILAADNDGAINNKLALGVDGTIKICGSSGFAGVEYCVDYSGNYSNRSLVDKEYVDGLSTIADNGLTNAGGTIVLGGALTGDTLVNIGSGTMYFSGETGNVVLKRGSGDYYGSIDIDNGEYHLHRQYGASSFSNIQASCASINICTCGVGGGDGGQVNISSDRNSTGGQVIITAFSGGSSNGILDVNIGGIRLESNNNSGLASVNVCGNLSGVFTCGNLWLSTTPNTGLISDDVLVRASTGEVKTVSGSALGEHNNRYLTIVVTGNTALAESGYTYLVNSPLNSRTLTLPASPVDGAAYKIKDVGGEALTYPITISGNGKNIDNASTVMINTEFGALEVVYNSTLGAWFVLSFVN